MISKKLIEDIKETCNQSDWVSFLLSLVDETNEEELLEVNNLVREMTLEEMIGGLFND